MDVARAGHTCGAVAAAAMRKAKPPLLSAGVVADVYVARGAIVRRVAARPSLQMRVDAGGIAAHVDRAADRMIAAYAAARDGADDAAAAARSDLARLCGEHRRDAGERYGIRPRD